MFLYIDTSNNEKMRLAIFDRQGGILVDKKIASKYQQSEKLLSSIDSMFKGLGKKIDNLKGVVVIKGPGGFTGVRIGVATANAIAWGLQIPIVGLKTKEEADFEGLVAGAVKKLQKTKTFRQVLPFYYREPNIG